MTEPMPPDIERLLEAERGREAVAPEIRDATWRSLNARLAPSGSGGPGGVGSTGSPFGSAIAKLPSIGLGVVLGVLGTLGVQRGVLPRPPAQLQHSPRVSISPLALSRPVSKPALPADDPKVRTKLPRTTNTAKVSTRTSLAAERALVDRARAALSTGDPEAALAAVRLHRTRHPRGQLAEEREALAVRALRAAGHDAEAEARQARFRRAYPESLFAPAISPDGG